jgi:hypothetical protein
MHLISIYNINEVDTSNTITSIIDTIKDLGITVTFFGMTVFVLITFFWTVQTHENIFINLKLVADLFESRLCRKVRYKPFKHLFFRRLAVATVFISIFLISLWFIVYSLTLEVINFAALCVISTFIVSYMTILFAFYVSVINYNLEFLEGILKSLVHRILKENCIDISRPNLHIYYQLIAMKTIQIHIFEISKLVNQCMGKQILTFIINAVFYITFGGYSVFVAVSNNEFGLLAISDILLTMYFLVTVIFIVYYAQKPNETVRKNY